MGVSLQPPVKHSHFFREDKNRVWSKKLSHLPTRQWCKVHLAQSIHPPNLNPHFSHLQWVLFHHGCIGFSHFWNLNPTSLLENMQTRVASAELRGDTTLGQLSFLANKLYSQSTPFPYGNTRENVCASPQHMEHTRNLPAPLVHNSNL